jgi:NIMA (never in mitosis gene a)-related kinase 8
MTAILLNWTDGDVYAWGNGENGELGHGQKKGSSEPIFVEALRDRKIITMGAGHGFSIFVSDSGVVFSCGDGSGGCLGHGDYNSISTPQIIGKIQYFITSQLIEIL